ncbi:GreA/GreB family elongation factor [uncultured Draconibacterium sp.]|uniref:sacsin N-terminal ATP-binding-like domain-containing protein n=1 Tax=uncultured Draconibacterium sp. TaxID=1573823 RepID=UPI0025F42804|nr:GreA/GreB family elongation factor [uncultured Draconibacterium sp.]
MSGYIEQLKEKRARWVTTNKENDFEDGITSLLTELYPDNAHFIYELLQNAEDTGAKKVSFELKRNELIFIHNGDKLFCDNDIEAITNIGKGTKKDDVNKIGKFGVGFKSVFSYTKSPSIYSGEYNFKITDLVVPKLIEPIIKKSTETVFIFPFNNESKTKNKAYDEIKEGLYNINRTTLLFLKSILQIEIKISDESYTITKHTDTVNKIATITNTKLNRKTKFLVFNKPLPNEGKLYVSIAFKLTRDKKTKIEKVVIDNESKVSIFFPAEKETSNLKFHIHAPFASTVARDSITDRKENKELVELIADLLCEATEWAKFNGFLDDNFLRCLPIEDDNLSEFYKPIQSKITNLFNTEPFLLCDNNEYHPAKNCWQTTNRIKEVISTQDLKILQTGRIKNDCFWTSKPFQRNASGRVNSFLKSLKLNSYSEDDFEKQILSLSEHFVEHSFDIIKELKNWKDEFGWLSKEFSSVIKDALKSKQSKQEITSNLFWLFENETESYIHSYYYQRSTEIKNIIRSNYSHYVLTNFLTNKSDEWLKGFYELIYKVIDVDDEYYDYDDTDSEYNDLRMFVRLNNKEFNFSKSECFFPSKTNLNSIKTFIISTGIYDENQNKKKESKSKKFLKNILGVKEISIEDEVNHILKRYEEGRETKYHDNILHLKLFFKFLKDNKSNFDEELFANKPFLINSDNVLTKPSLILIDEPIEQTSLVKLADKNYKSLHSFYFETERNISIKKFKEFLSAVGCNFTLPIKNKSDDPRIKEKLGNNERETYYGKNENFYLPIHRPFKKPKIKTSLIIWNELSKLQDVSCFDAIYKANGSSVTRTCDSDVIEELQENAWIPNSNGEFFKPQDITEDTLHQNFKINDQNGWLSRINFGQNAIKNQKLENVKEEIKEHTGYSLSTLEEAHKVGITEEEISKLIQDKKRKKIDLKDGIKNHNRNIDSDNSSLNPSIVSNAEKYREKAQQQLYENINRSENNHKSYNYSKKVKIGKSETLEFLKKQYQGHCQICGFTFSQTGNKGNYFEMFDWLSEKISNQETNIIEVGTSLSLCSRCHSILKHGDFGADFLDSIQEIEKSDYKNFAECFELVVNEKDIPEVFEFIEMDMYKLPIRKLNQEENIFFSEEHFIHFHNVLTLHENNQDQDFEEQVTEQENITIIKDELPEVETKKVVEIGSFVTVQYSNTNNPLRLKMVAKAQNTKDKNGTNLISIHSPFGKKIMGKPEGYRFEMGKNLVEILSIDK